MLLFPISQFASADNEYNFYPSFQKADFALAPLTISAIRQEYVQFVKPYDVVEAVYVRLKEKAKVLDLLQFMEPFTIRVWVITGFICLLTGFLLFAIDYFSPFGWRRVAENVEGIEFNLGNSIWFSVASILLQGPDNTPRSFSGKSCPIFSGY